MDVTFWFDPACPFCWMTSRWVRSVAPARDLRIDWQPISLLFKNGFEPDHPYYGRVARTRDLLRVVEATRAAGHADRIGELYTEFGRRIHHEDRQDFDVAEILSSLGLDPALAGALDDDGWDATIRAAMDAGLALTGTDVGTPLVAIAGGGGERVGFFGPVITEFPTGEAALRLWDGFVLMITTPGFYELKRTRDRMPGKPPLDA
jgi:2-hydroxychromene-2-carboxylate isomerase